MRPMLFPALVLTAASCGSSGGSPSAEPSPTTAATLPDPTSAIEHGLDGAGLVVVQRDDGIVDEEYWREFGPERIEAVMHPVGE